MTTDIEKLEQMVHYIISCTANIPSVGKTVLWKLMYFSDFDFYEIHEKMLTGEQYRKIDHGPAPTHFDNIKEKLMLEKKIRHVKMFYHGKPQEKYISLKNPDTSLLSKEEIQAIERTIQRYVGLNATQISELSHLDMPWKATKEKDIIDYNLVFYRDNLTSVRVYSDDDD